MPTYAIGDVQGCFKELTQLLDKINFDETNDQLWFVGDLVNRGPDSLAVINFVIDLGDCAITVLGNHDLHMLAISEGLATPKKSDTLSAVLNSTDVHKLMAWIRQQPLAYHDAALNFSMVHAGLMPQWDMRQALELAEEVSLKLKSDDYHDFLKYMYGNTPDSWDNFLIGNDRLRFIVNCFTRMRYISNKHQMDFHENAAPGSQAEHLTPWFAVADRKSKHNRIVFGHWSTVTLGNIDDFTPYRVYPVDTGCVWKGSLTALRLEDEVLFSVPAA